MEIEIKTENFDEVIRKMKQFPEKWNKALATTLIAILMKIWELVPPYPPPPPSSTYTRTGTLGRSLGGGEMGGRSMGSPEIFERKIGSGQFKVAFGTKLEYATFVVGERQTETHERSGWWTFREHMKTLIEPVNGLFQAMLRGLARWLEEK